MQEALISVSDKTAYEFPSNRSLDDVIALLEREIVHLQTSLETARLTEHPKRSELIRWHVRTLDERQDTLERLRQMLLARDSAADPSRH